MNQRTARDIYTTIDKVRVGDTVHLRSGATFTVTALRLATKDWQFCKYGAPSDVWEVEGIDHDSVIVDTGKNADGTWEVTQHFADHPFKTTINTKTAIACWRGSE